MALALSSLPAVWLDPSEPAKHEQFAYGLLVAYLAYSPSVAVTVFRSETWSRGAQIVTHAFDLVVFLVLSFFTAGPSSPFIAYFAFALVCATLRWQWRGTLWTAVASLGAFVGTGLYFVSAPNEATFELHTFIIRGVYLVVVAVLLGYLGAHEQQTFREMSGWAVWPQRIVTDLRSLATDLLDHASRVLDASRLVLMWTESDEPWLEIAETHAAGIRWHREGTLEIGSFVADPYQSLRFIASGLGAAAQTVSWHGHDRVERSPDGPVRPTFSDRFGAHGVISVPLDGETGAGRLFVLDKPAMPLDDLLLAEIVGGMLTARLDHFYLMAQLRTAAATEERIRLARDLHDGVRSRSRGSASGSRGRQAGADERLWHRPRRPRGGPAGHRQRATRPSILHPGVGAVDDRAGAGSGRHARAPRVARRSHGA